MTARRTTKVAPFLARQIKALDAETAATVPRVLGSADAEALHDMRVAIRRLRTLLRVARAVYGRFHADAVRGAFSRLQKATGSLRDEEALTETLDVLGVRDASFAAWRQRRLARDRTLRRAVLAKIRSGELRRARAMLHALLVLPVKPAKDAALAKFARRAVERARKTVESLRDAAPTDAQGLHDLRIAYKNLRYAAEIFADALPADLAAMAAPAARFQKRLGDIHDVDVALVSLRRARGLSLRARALTLKALHHARIKRVKKYLAEMSPAPPAETSLAKDVEPKAQAVGT